MEPAVTLASLRHYRKATRALAEHLRGELVAVLETLTPLFRAETILGDYVKRSVLSMRPDPQGVGRRGELMPDRSGRGSVLSVKRDAAAPSTAREIEEAQKYARAQVPLKEAVPGADSAFAEVARLYDAVAPKKPFDLAPGLKPPLPIDTTALEISPVDYPYVAKSAGESKRVMVSAPLTWVVTYAGFSPTRLRTLLADPNRPREELQSVLLHNLLLHVVLERKPGLRSLLGELLFPARTETLAEFGDLPLTLVGSAVRTERLPDDLILESTEIAGVAVSEEIVQLSDLFTSQDARQERILGIVRETASGSGEGG